MHPSFLVDYPMLTASGCISLHSRRTWDSDGEDSWIRKSCPFCPCPFTVFFVKRPESDLRSRQQRLYYLCGPLVEGSMRLEGLLVTSAVESCFAFSLVAIAQPWCLCQGGRDRSQWEYDIPRIMLLATVTDSTDDFDDGFGKVGSALLQMAIAHLGVFASNEGI